MPALTNSYSILSINDFHGGWNPRDAWSEVADNELPDVINMTLDQRGGLSKRLGVKQLNYSGQGGGGTTQLLFYSKATDRIIIQNGTALKASSDVGANFTTIKTFSTSARAAVVDFLGKVVVIHPVDRAFTYDGSTFSSVLANSPAGNAITVWQNALWSCGDPANPSRITRSDLGAITWPATLVTNDVRVKDDQPLTAIGGGEGMDVQGRAGFLCFKEDSTYRVHSITDGAYTVLDYSYGASGPLCITTNNGMTAALSRKGIIVMRGDSSAPVLASYKVDPLFSTSQLTFAQSANMCAGNYGDRMVFSLPWDGSTVNNLTLEYHPQVGWIVPHSFGVTCFSEYTKNTRLLLGGPTGDSGFVYHLFSGGSDRHPASAVGVPIACRAQTRWFETNTGSEARYRRAVVNGRGAFSLYVKRNYESGEGERFPVAITGSGGVWGTFVWGTEPWGTTVLQDYQEIYSLGIARAVSFEIQESSEIVGTSVPFLDEGSAPELGAISFYGLNVDMIPLGRS